MLGKIFLIPIRFQMESAGTIWSTKGEMCVLGNYLLVPNYLKNANGHFDCEFSIWGFAIASDSKVVASMRCDEHFSVSLVIARKTGDNIWESNTLYSRDDDKVGRWVVFALEGSWLATAEAPMNERKDYLKLTLWEDDVQQDISLPSWKEQNEIRDMMSVWVQDIAMELPFIMLLIGGVHRQAEGQDFRTSSMVINVYRVAEGAPRGILFKSIARYCEPGISFFMGGIVSNAYLLGIVQQKFERPDSNGAYEGASVELFEKKSLKNERVAAENTRSRQMFLPAEAREGTLVVSLTN